MERGSDMAEPIKTTCPYCGVGCGVIATQQNDGSIAIKGDPDHPANFGRLCSKGAALGETVDMEGRLLYPKVNGKRTDWDSALNLVARTFNKTIAEHGPDSVAFYVSGQLLTEDYYVANKLMKGFIGSGNIDTNSRLCMASSVAGHRRAFGSDTVPGVYEDLELADLIILVGSNLAWCHPVLYQRIVAAKEKRPHMKVVLIDPRRTMSADIADLHLSIAPDGDVALFMGLLNYLSENDFLNRRYVDEHTRGFKTAIAAAAGLSLDDIITHTGLSQEDIIRFFTLWANTEKTVTVYSQGVNQSSIGTDKVNAIINCHLATGRIGRAGMGPFSVTGQPNAMGGREVGGLANMLAAHMDIEDEGHRDIVRRYWQAPNLVTKAGLKAVDMFDAVGDGRIKAIWIMATNPVVSMPDAGAVEEALKKCPFVVVSEIVDETDTSRHAHVKLPALGWGEKEGVVTNSERRISRQRQVMSAPGEARADWWHLAEIAKRMGFAEGFNYASAADIFREFCAQSSFENNGNRDFDIGAYAGITDSDFAALKPFQWPAPAHSQDLRPITRFFANGEFYTPDRKAKFIPVQAPSRDVLDAELTFVLNTGRIRDHWHTMTRTAKSARLSAHIAEPFADFHPKDAQRLGIETADLVRLYNGRGEIIVRVHVTDRQSEGDIFVPMHWTDQYASCARVDCLISANPDPYSGQPALKRSRVKVEKYHAAQFGFVASCARPNLTNADYWAVAKTDAGWRAEVAFENRVENCEDLAREVFGLSHNAPVLTYADKCEAVTRIAAFDGSKLIGLVYLSQTPVALSRNWASDQLKETFDNLSARFRVVAGRPAANMPDKGAIICSCMGVGVNDIVSAIRSGCRNVEAIGECTTAGTNCGSCKSEIRVIIDEHQLVAAE